MDLPDDAARERVAQRKVDPKTGVYYDMRTKPPKDADVAGRLIQHPDDADQAFANYLKEYPCCFYMLLVRHLHHASGDFNEISVTSPLCWPKYRR